MAETRFVGWFVAGRLVTAMALLTTGRR
jgi:hypothetical protein